MRTRRRLRIGRIVLGALAALALAVVVVNWTWGRLPGQPAMTGRIVRVGDVNVRVLEHSGADPAIVLIHGLPGTADDFDKVTALLPGRRTIAFDRPGFGFSSGGFASAQARFVQFLSWPVVQPLADVTFSQLVRTASAKQGDEQAFSPGPVDPAHERRLLALNMRHEDLDAYAGEQLAANGVFAGIDPHLVAIATPAVVIQGDRDQLVEPAHGRKLAATLPHAQLEMVSGGHMVPYVHPGVVAAAAKRLAAGAH